MRSILVFLVVVLVECRSPDHLYRIKEELPANHIVGYLNYDIPKFRNGDFVHYKIINSIDKGVHCFKLEETSSKLILNSRIDRESLCSNSDLICYIILKIALRGTDRFVTIKIEIEDINDHSPSWHVTKFRVTFNDGENAGSRQSIPSAKDLDVGENGDIKYTLEGTENVFMLVQEHGLYLQTLKQLDREVKGSYQIHILATDKGSVARSSRLEVEVDIIDINDNNPRFSTSVFRPPKVIPETIPIGSVILTLSATDADSGQNGEFSFFFSPTETTNAKTFFVIKPSGEIIVQRQLDYDNGNHKFEFKVIVKDHAGLGYERSSESRVEITISDENDESPTIITHPINTNVNTGFIKIDENKEPLTPVALIHATDKDFKESDTVTCDAKSNNKLDSFHLIPTNENNDHKLVASRSFDRELEQRISVSITCVDSANHKESRNVTIEVGDLNDNSPKFIENIFHLYVKENVEPGTVVRNKIFATDSDELENGLITYSIPANDQTPFSIESRSAIVRTRERLDRELKNFYQFMILATDHGKPPLSSSATIIVHIEDENDNPVTIEPFVGEFRITENLPQNTQVGRVIAKDLDNQTIYYYLKVNPEMAPFKIDSIEGIITTKTELDRERNAKYQFHVFATDKLNTASILITIFVEDTNDNSPNFKMPNNTFNSITVSPSEAVGFNLVKIHAEDQDEKENSQIQYFITNVKVQGLFSIDKDSGVLYLESTFYNYRSDDKDFFSLDLEACDMGKLRKCTPFKGFKVHLQKKTDDLNHKGQQNLLLETSGFNENIIVGLIGFLVMMILVTIVIIIILRSRAKGNNDLRKDALRAISAPIQYSQNPSGKGPFETDQCSVEICELTNRLSPDQETTVPMNKFSYYNLGDQYQSGNIISTSTDHAYHAPFITTYQQHILDPRSMQRVTNDIGYYSKYDMNDNPKLFDDSESTFLKNEQKHYTMSSIPTTAITTPSQKSRKFPLNAVKKPQSSFV